MSDTSTPSQSGATVHPPRCGEYASISDFDRCEKPQGHDGHHAYVAPKCGAEGPLDLRCSLDWDHTSEHSAIRVVQW